jgi:serine protease Do
MNPGWLESLSSNAAEVARSGRAVLARLAADGRGEGSGVVWAPGLIVTNAHVARSPKLGAQLPGGREVRTERIAWDGESDLAALRFEAGEEESATIGDSARLQPGEWVYAIGHPWGVRGAVTGGVVIGWVRERRDSGKAPDLLAMSLHLRPGHSGGPVVNARGEVVGVNTMMNGPDVGLAVPSARIVQFLADHDLARVPTVGAKAA